MTDLPSDIEALKKLVQQLLEDVARLTAENIQLKAENAELKRRLGLNSGNSDKPPSSDGYQNLRPAKVKQKVSGCFRTQTGAAAYARLQATVATLRKQGLHVFASLRDLFLGKPIVLGCTG